MFMIKLISKFALTLALSQRERGLDRGSTQSDSGLKAPSPLRAEGWGEGALSFLFVLLLSLSSNSLAASLPDTIAKVKPSIVGVGTYLPTRQPRSQLQGTGFVVGDGYHIVTNAHVVAGEVDTLNKERRVIYVGTGKNPQVRDVRILKRDDVHDIAILRITGQRLPAMKLSEDDYVREGESVAFTGFPIGAVLGLYPATHRGIISSITPVATPAFFSGSLDPAMIRRLKNPYMVYQLDATAYPGNSGSPLYLSYSGEVVGIINKVFVKEGKEAAIKAPSGITYAIPARHIKKLLNTEK